MTRTAGAPIGCQRPSRFWGLGCPKIYHEVEDTLGRSATAHISVSKFFWFIHPFSTLNCRYENK
ncbi:hypothetical protein [Thiolapillus sp.]|uniref:hypothetical protein n=1 Tax=Thiolapillus sp. TaxID=2017437 RepID=UPI003AF42435